MIATVLKRGRSISLIVPKHRKLPLEQSDKIGERQGETIIISNHFSQNERHIGFCECLPRGAVVTIAAHATSGH